MVLPVMLLGMALVTEIETFDLHGHLAGDLMVVGAAAAAAAARGVCLQED